MLFVYTIIYSCFPQGKRVPQKAPYLMSVSATKQVLLLPPSINKELAACKYSYGILHVVVVSKFAADDLNSGWLYESFQERQCTSLAIGLFLLHNWIKRLSVRCIEPIYSWCHNTALTLDGYPAGFLSVVGADCRKPMHYIYLLRHQLFW